MNPTSAASTGSPSTSSRASLSPEAAATRIQAAFRGFRARQHPALDEPRFPMKFVTWRNTTQPTQAEHMTVKFGSGGARTARYVDFRQGVGNRDDIAPLQGVHNLLSSAPSSSTATPSAPPPKPFMNLAYGEHTPGEHRARFLARPALPSDAGRGFRYDAREYIRARVSFRELRALRSVVADRRRDGVFHLFGEASRQEPKTTRCMTVIETLAGLRGMQLNNANTSAMARQFHELNQASDRFRGTTTAPKLRRYVVAGAERASSPTVTATAAVRHFDGRYLDRHYWTQHDARAHNVGRPRGATL